MQEKHFPIANEGNGVTVTWPHLPQRSIWSDNNAPGAQSEKKPSTVLKGGQENRVKENQFSMEAMPDELPGKWEYLDHTADVQLHVWGTDHGRAHATAVLALHAYMVDDAANSVDCHLCKLVTATGHDDHSLLFAILDEFLYLFHTESFVATRAVTLRLDNDGSNRQAVIRAWGGTFDQSVHKQGTEVKAITYSNMQIVKDGADGNVHIYVIVDI